MLHTAVNSPSSLLTGPIYKVFTRKDLRSVGKKKKRISTIINNPCAITNTQMADTDENAHLSSLQLLLRYTHECPRNYETTSGPNESSTG